VRPRAVPSVVGNREYSLLSRGQACRPIDASVVGALGSSKRVIARAGPASLVKLNPAVKGLPARALSHAGPQGAGAGGPDRRLTSDRSIDRLLGICSRQHRLRRRGLERPVSPHALDLIYVARRGLQNANR